jgi:HEAT repeat protein
MLGLACTAILAGGLLLSPGRDFVHGVVNNEAFASGRPLSYWVRQLSDNDSSNRRAAIDAIGHMGRDASAAVPALASIAKSDDIALRTWAVSNGLEKIGPAAVPTLCDMMKDQDRRLRTIAIIAVGHIGPEAKVAVPSLVKALKDEFPLTRAMAANALGDMGSAAKDAVPALIEALQDKNGGVRNEASLALKKIDPKALSKATIPWVPL